MNASNEVPPSVAAQTHVRPTLGRWGAWLRRFSARRWFTPVAGLITAADVVIILIPTQTLLVATTLLHPQRWRLTAFWFTIGGVLGGAALAAAIGQFGPEIVVRLLGDTPPGTFWTRLETLVQAHGAWMLFGIALLPWPVRSGVAICALAGVPMLHTVGALLGGRLLGFGTLAFVVSRSPLWLNRVPVFAKIRTDVQTLEAGHSQTDPRSLDERKEYEQTGQ